MIIPFRESEVSWQPASKTDEKQEKIDQQKAY
jgi:hypothetical protein